MKFREDSFAAFSLFLGESTDELKQPFIPKVCVEIDIAVAVGLKGIGFHLCHRFIKVTFAVAVVFNSTCFPCYLIQRQLKFNWVVVGDFV